MDPLFLCGRPHRTSNDWAAENDLNLFKTLCSISTCNIVAFTSTSELEDSEVIPSLGFHVYVADLNQIWNAFKVTSNKFPISVLEWDILGKYLLVGDSSGCVQLWVQKDCMISEWHQLYTVKFPGEHILKAVFFHNGKKIHMSSEKKEYYMEKFQRVKFMPSVRQFGGVPAEGVIFISFTGMLGSFLIPSEPPVNMQANAASYNNQQPYNLPSVTESLGLTRNFCTAADICYGKNGNFLVAISNGEIKVQCYRVIVKKVDNRTTATITSHSLPSFFLMNDDHLQNLKIEKLKWISQEDSGDSLIVAANHTGGSVIQIWSLMEKSTPIHKLFQTNKPEVFKTIDWSHQCQYSSLIRLMDISTSKLTFGGSAPFIVVALENFKTVCLNADNLREIAEDSINFSWSDHADQRSKMFASGSQIASLDVSWMGKLLIQLDTKGQIFAHKLHLTNQDHQMIPEQYILQLLEYCLFTGYDYLDILLSIKFQHLDIVEMLSESFYRQPSSVQQYYYVSFITMKTNLYRLSVAGQSKAHDLTNLLMLHSILITFKSILRPSDLSCHDKGPIESLALVLSDSVPDVDKVLLNIEAKDFTVEQFTLQSLQQLIQWVADLALNILARLPEYRCMVGQNKNSGYDISKDLVALNSIRELLVIIRIWGLFKPQCLPVFSRTADNLDIMSTLFRLFTRLALTPTNSEPDESIIDECCMLPSQVLIPQLQSPVINCRTGLLSPPVLHFNNPLKFTYGVEPDQLKFCAELPVVEGSLSNDNMIDSIRHIQLGKQPKSVRKCSRCGAVSNVGSIARTAALRAWEQRWGNRCLCGFGFWTLKVFNP